MPKERSPRHPARAGAAGGGGSDVVEVGHDRPSLAGVNVSRNPSAVGRGRKRPPRIVAQEGECRSDNRSRSPSGSLVPAEVRRVSSGRTTSAPTVPHARRGMNEFRNGASAPSSMVWGRSCSTQAGRGRLLAHPRSSDDWGHLGDPLRFEQRDYNSRCRANLPMII